ncbi:MAG: hypothetical protein DBX59_05155 [Bacillota bacterium]|nr:MAG: hypothetical protein DBX59_05155 [Bacillota bacterium]
MLNYDKMNSVLDNLDSCAESLSSIVDTQKTLETLSNKVESTISELKQNSNNIQEYTNSVAILEKAHFDISNKIDNVMQDYQKLHSAFEYLEIELKKTNSVLDTVKTELVNYIDTTQEKSITAIEELKKEIKASKRKQKIAFFIGLGGMIAILALSIIGLFI